MVAMDAGELKTGVAVQKVDLLKSAVPDETRKSELEKKKETSKTDWKDYLMNLQSTK